MEKLMNLGSKRDYSSSSQRPKRVVVAGRRNPGYVLCEQSLLSVCRSFTLRCVLLLVLLGTRDDLFGECIIGDEILEADKPIPVQNVEGVLGQRGRLPCDVGTPSRDDKLHMVLWFRDRDSEPIYRYDVRDKPSTDAKRSSTWGERLYFQTMSEPAHLSIQDLQLKDEGMYRCRVDFKNSPTRNMRINLTIIVPPDIPVIYKADGQVASNPVGPFNEGSDLVLVCEVSGGRPRPVVRWFLDNQMIDDSSTSSAERNDGLLVNSLFFTPLQRQHFNASFVCQASNTNLTEAKSATALINLFLRPLSVSITTKETELMVHRRYEIECVAVGSSPPAVISWYKTGRMVKKAAITPPSDDINVTRSILHLVPTIEDNGKILTCRGENPHIQGSFFEDRWILNVLYAPKVMLQLGANMVADDIKEGDDVYFECSVGANPLYTRLAWFHNGRELRQNMANRIIMSNTRLVLQRISRHTAGNYTCTAANAQGNSTSNVVHLRVKYVPTCKHHSESLIGAMKLETVQILCEMSADPPLVEFRWTFNRSGVEVISVPMSQQVDSGTMSTLSYSPQTDMNYGTLACYGSNAVGRGVSGPCYFQIVQAGRPFPPKNCSIFNKTEQSLSVSCTEGFNGGLPQHFVLEVVDLQAKKINLNASYKIPLFYVEGMESGVVYRFIIYSVNDKGRSEPFMLDGITFSGVAKLTSDAETAEMNPLVAILVGCTLVLIVVLSVTIIAIWKRSRRKKPPVVAKALKRESESANFENGLEAALTKVEQNGLEEIGNPDVVPNKNGKDRSGGIRGFIRIHKTPPARRRKKDLEVKNNGETVALTLVETPDGELHRNHNHKSSLLMHPNHSSTTRESRI